MALTVIAGWGEQENEYEDSCEEESGKELVSEKSDTRTDR